MKKDVRLYIQDIVESLEKIMNYTTGIKEGEFYKDEKLQDAVVRRLEIVGEAAKHVPQPIRDKYSDIPWRQIAGMRDVLIHEYGSVDIDRLWQAAVKDCPVLKVRLKEILKEF